MAKPDAWRLDAAAYPFSVEVPTRWADLDPLGHINNVSMAGLFEEGRGRFNMSLGMRRERPDVRWLIAAVSLNYLGEAHHPVPTTIATGVGRVGNSSWTLFSGAFQKGVCLATCDTTIVYTDANGPCALPDGVRGKLESMLVSGA